MVRIACDECRASRAGDAAGAKQPYGTRTFRAVSRSTYCSDVAISSVVQALFERTEEAKERGTGPSEWQCLQRRVLQCAGG